MPQLRRAYTAWNPRLKPIGRAPFGRARRDYLIECFRNLDQRVTVKIIGWLRASRVGSVAGLDYGFGSASRRAVHLD